MPTYASLFISGHSAWPNYTNCIIFGLSCVQLYKVYVLGLYLDCHMIHLYINTSPQVVLCIVLNTCSVDQTIHSLSLEDKTQVLILLNGARSLVDQDSLWTYQQCYFYSFLLKLWYNTLDILCTNGHFSSISLISQDRIEIM